MLFKLCSSLLSLLPAEKAHDLMISNLDWMTTMGMHNDLCRMPQEDPVEVMGIRFPNTVGLAAGLDVNGTCVSAFGSLGFGHVEVGSVCPVAQPTKTASRSVRLKSEAAILDSTPPSSCGVEQTVRNLRSAAAFHLRGGVLGINLGKNAATSPYDARLDYLYVLKHTYDKADYLTANLVDRASRLTTPLTNEVCVVELLATLRDERRRLIEEEGLAYKPIAVKLADMDNDSLKRAADLVVEHGLDGIIATGSFTKPANESPVEGVTGLLSGRPLTERSTQSVAILSEHLKGAVPIIASGGIMSTDDAIAKMQAGASLVQLCSGLIFNGPTFAADCVSAVAQWRRANLLT